jgi:hypothetical protein
MKKFFLLAIILLFSNNAFAQIFSASHIISATDCTAETTGKSHTICYEVDSQRFFQCVPSVGACDTPGEWIAVTSLPGGSDTQVQLNDSGAFGADAEFIYNKTTNQLTIGASTIDTSTALDLNATDKALRVTRLSDPTTDVTVPRNGMIAYDSTDDIFMGYSGGSWTGIGIVTLVGDCAKSTCFDGTAAGGTQLTGALTEDTLAFWEDGALNFWLNTDTPATIKGRNLSQTATDTIFDTHGAGTVQLGSADVTSITILTDSTGDGELNLPRDSVSGTEIDSATITADNLNTTGTADSTTFLRGDFAWTALSTVGDVAGPASSTDNAITRFDGTTGKLLQNSGTTLDDNGNINLQASTNDETKGFIYKNSIPFIHTYAGGTGFGNNTYVGESSGNLTQTGASAALDSHNTAVGQNTLNDITDGYQNTMIGAGAGELLTTGDSNTAVGFDALKSITVNDDNVAIGNQALEFATGSVNIAIGNQAGKGVSGSSSFSSNMLIGNQAGLNLTTGGSNIIIGASAGSTLTTGDTNILIGAATNTTSSSSIQELNIGGAIFGDDIGTSGPRIGISTFPDTSTVLDVYATDMALRVTRVADPSANITVPRNGMIAYDSTDDELQAYIGGSWVDIGGAGGGGDVTGPASSTDNAVARFDSTTGKIIQNSAVTIDDQGHMMVSGSLNVDGTLTVGTLSTDVPNSRFRIGVQDTDKKGLVVQMPAGTTETAFEIQNESGVPNAKFNTTGNGALVLNYSGTMASATYPGYVLSVQNIGDGGEGSWIEILNQGGPGKGAFFGMYGDQFQLFNWQGGDIEFWTFPTAEDGRVRFTITDAGNFGFSGAGGFGWAYGWGGGVGVLGIANAATPPTTSATTAALLYAKSGLLYYMAPSNQERQIASLAATETFTNKTLTTPIITGKVDRNDVAVNDNDCTGEQGLYWYDTTDSRFEFCNANSGAPSLVGGDVLGPSSAVDNAIAVYNGTTGKIIKGGTQTTVSSNGVIDLVANVAGEQKGFISKGATRFLHTYFGGTSTGSNIFLGKNAGNFTMSGATDTGSYMIGIGESALASVTTGYYNTCIGYQSCTAATTSKFNTAIGPYVLSVMAASTDNNTSIGYESGKNIAGDDNVTIGYQTGKGATNPGSSNTQNVFIGSKTASSITTGVTQNTVVGYLAATALTTGDNNTFIGMGSGYTTTTGSDNIVIGVSKATTSAGASNQINIGGLLYGSTSGVNGVGISVVPTSITARLHIAAGTATASTAPLKFNTGPLLTTPEAGAIEFLTDNIYMTTTTNTARKRVLTGAVITLTDGATPALNAIQGNVFELTALGDRTIAVPSNPTAGQRITIRHIASGADRTLALNTGTGGFRFGTTITGLTLTTSGTTDYIDCIYNSTANKWDVVSYVKGY